MSAVFYVYYSKLSILGFAVLYAFEICVIGTVSRKRLADIFGGQYCVYPLLVLGMNPALDEVFNEPAVMSYL